MLRTHGLGRCASLERRIGLLEFRIGRLPDPSLGWRHLSGPILLTVLAGAILSGSAPRVSAEGIGSPSLIHLAGHPSTVRSGDGFADAAPRHHRREGGNCSDCHVTRAPVRASAGFGDLPAAGAGATEPPPRQFLLKAIDPLDLCLGCHDGRMQTPDVVGHDSNGLTLRSAGHFSGPEQRNPSGHDLGRNLTPTGSELCTRCHGGGQASAKVTCIDCHDPHGNGVARNLRWASAPDYTPPLGLLVNPVATGMARYEAENVAYGTLDSDALREVTNMCVDCHHTFSGSNYVDPDGDGTHIRHPSYDSERGSRNSIRQASVMGVAMNEPVAAHWEGGIGSGFGSTARVKFVVSQATDYASARVVDANTNGVFCLSCHQAHGSQNAFAMRWDVRNGYGAAGCDQCHLIANVGVDFAGP